MMSRLEAGERLAAITDRAIAAGNMDRFDAGRITRNLEDAMRGERGKVAKASPSALAAMGIAVSGDAAPSEEPLSDV